MQVARACAGSSGGVRGRAFFVVLGGVLGGNFISGVKSGWPKSPKIKPTTNRAKKNIS